MTGCESVRAVGRCLASYAAALGLCLAALTVTFKLWRADLSRPMYYQIGGDTYAVLALVKGHLEHDWYLTNDRLGAPGSYDMHDYPITDVAALGLFKVLGWAAGGNPFLALNLFYLLSYPL